MAFKLKSGNTATFKQMGSSPAKVEEKELTEDEKAANLAHAAREKWFVSKEGEPNVDLLHERGFKWDADKGRWLDDKNLQPSQWKTRMYLSEESQEKGQRHQPITTPETKGGKRVLTEEEQYDI